MTGPNYSKLYSPFVFYLISKAVMQPFYRRATRNNSQITLAYSVSENYLRANAICSSKQYWESDRLIVPHTPNSLKVFMYVRLGYANADRVSSQSISFFLDFIMNLFTLFTFGGHFWFSVILSWWFL